MDLLLIEDDAHLTLSLYRHLGSIYKVDSAHTGSIGLKKALSKEFDIIILDLQLPDMNGLKICEQLRSNAIKTPVLVLTGEVETNSKVRLLDSGANDYLTKPFDIQELLARLRALTRSRNKSKDGRSRLVVGDLTLDSLRHKVERGGKDIVLTRKEFALLEYLMNYAGIVISRPKLAQSVWSEDWPGTANTIDVHIKYLRDKVDKPFNSPLIKTVRGFGYKIDESKVVANSKLTERSGNERIAAKSSD